jgi:hypothetical protein
VTTVDIAAPKAKLGIAAALASALLAAVLVLNVAAAPAAGASACPSFRVLHDDRIGPASLPAGNYTVTIAPASGVSCSNASKLFARFLEDYDGVLPRPWSVVAQGSGKAAFTQGGKAGFSVARGSSGGGGGEGGGNPALGALCPGSFSVLNTTRVSPLLFVKGKYLLYLPARTGITCARASALFTRFLGAGGSLPAPWQVKNQTATFFKPAHPARSAFRVEPFAGAGPA